MKVGILEFPGSTNFSETFRAFHEILGLETQRIWHQQESLGDADLVVLPGGFSFGDHLRPGGLARMSPVCGLVRRHAKKGGLVLGIGNGFQILCEIGVLPGALLTNQEGGFLGNLVNLSVEETESSFTKGLKEKKTIKLPVACYSGRYWADRRSLKDLENDGRVVFRYLDDYGDFDAENPFNSSSNGIAAILSRHGNVLGMMPHPERAIESIHSSEDGRLFLDFLRQ